MTKTGINDKLLRRYPKLNEIIRYISWFDKETEEYAGFAYVENAPLDVLQNLYGFPPDKPMIEVFDVTEEQAQVLSKYTDIEFDFSRFDYDLETCYDYKRSGPWEGGAPFPVPSGK